MEASEFILDTIQDALFVLDKEGKIMHCNKASLELLKYSSKEIIGRPLLDFFRAEEYSSEKLDTLSEKRKLLHQKADLVSKEGNIIHTVYSASVAENDIYGYVGIIISFHDITKQEKLEKELYRLAHFDDALTGLPNRRYFFGMLTQVQESLPRRKNSGLLVFGNGSGWIQGN